MYQIQAFGQEDITSPLLPNDFDTSCVEIFQAIMSPPHKNLINK